MDKKEISMEVRLLLAFLLMGAVIFVTPYFYKTPAGPTADKSAANKPGATTAEAMPPAPVAPAPPHVNAPTEAPGQVQAEQEQTVVINTELLQVTFSNKGGVVRTWVLKHFKDHKGKPLDLVYSKALDKVPAPFSIQFRDQAPQPDPNMALYKVDRPDDLTVRFEYSNGHVSVKKTFKFAPKSYLAAVSSQVSL